MGGEVETSRLKAIGGRPPRCDSEAISRNALWWTHARRVGIVMGILVLGGLAACRSLAPRAEDHYARAEQLLNERQYELAAAELRRAIALKPDFPEAHYKLAQILFYALGDVKGAIAEFQTAIAQGYSHPAIHYELAKVFLDADLFDDAIAQLGEAIRKGYETPAVRLELGRAYLAKGEWERAEQELQRAIELSAPVEFPLAHYYLGEVYERQEKWALAIAQFETYVQIASAHAEMLSEEAREGLVPGAEAFSFPSDLPNVEAVRQRIASLKMRAALRP
ncbi:MAG: tetratricopeptide repeat protein [Blastocatellia bacterium]|nr:tetratricopeptide repeat protein [Blastocatellia bacterium]MCX7751252.1 tetratricopeptide repeat protein [Blastocatellia bacterium]MDW8256724.1 tetratricopeptide repeat protein [Acidobacteriota bacterium]